MLNPIEAYQDAGRSAKTARKNGDISRFNFEYGHAMRMMRLESGDDKDAARAAFNKAYKEA